MCNNSRINIKSGETRWPSHQNYIKKVAKLTLGLKQATALQTFDCIIIYFFNTGYSRHHQNLRHSPGGYRHSYIREDRRPWRRWGTSDWRLPPDGAVTSRSSTWHTVETQFSTFCLSAGELTLEEFISGAREHPDIMEMLTKMMDLTHVLEIIVSGQQKKAINWAADTFGRGGGRGAGEKGLGTTDGEPGPVLHCHTKNCTALDWGALCTTDSCPKGSRGTALCCLLELLQFWVLSITRAWAPEIVNGRGGPISFQLEMDDQKQEIPWLYFNGMEVCNLKILCETLESQIGKNSDGFVWFFFNLRFLNL